MTPNMPKGMAPTESGELEAEVETEPILDENEFMICVRCFRDHTFAVSKEPLDVDDNARNGGYEAEVGAPTIDNAEDALREVYGMMKEAMNTDAEQSFQQAFGPPQERY